MHTEEKHNPWSFPSKHVAPDGRNWVAYQNPVEFSNGSPLGGEVTLEPAHISFHRGRFFCRFFGGPPLWSGDSRFVGIPEWEPLYNRQRLTIFDLNLHLQTTTSVAYAVIELESLTHKSVSFIDSPRYQKKSHRIELSEFSWSPIVAYPDFAYSDGRSVSFEKLAEYLQRNRK